VLTWHYVVLPLEGSSSLALRFIGRFGIEAWTGVDLFFVLSGFLIGGILIDTKRQVGYFRTFYMRRICRILPMYFALLGASSLVAMVFHNNRGSPVMPRFVYATFAQNFWLMHHSWDAWMGHTWSLAVEEQFYLVLPFIVWILPRPKLWKATIGIVFATLIFRSLMYLRFYPGWGVVAYASLFCRADALMLGVLGAILVRSPRWFPELNRSRRILSLSVAVCVIAFLLITAKGWGMLTRPISTLGYTLIAASYLLLILGTILSDGLLKRVFCMRWLRGMGTISYGLYMVHPAILIVVYSYFGYEQPRLDRAFDVVPMLLAVALSVGVSLLSWKYFESRLVRFGHKLRFQARESPVAV